MKSFSDRSLALGLFLAGFLSLLLTEQNVGFTRDESVYFYSSSSYARWFQKLVQDPSLAVTDAEIVRSFDVNHEHPPLMKMAFGLSHQLFHNTLHWLRPAAAYRLPSFLLAALALPLLYLWGTKSYGRTAGLFAAGAFFLVPRQFFDSHLSCFDIPVAVMWLLTVFAFWRAQTAPRWWLYTGLFFGLALVTKHNALTLPWLLLPFAFARAFSATKELPQAREKVLWLSGLFAGTAVLYLVLYLSLGPEAFVQKFEPLSPHTALFVLFASTATALVLQLAKLSKNAARPLAALTAMLLLGPLVFYLLWPYLWHHPIERTAWWLSFHARHNHYAWFYLGKLLRAPPFPLEYVVVKTALTVPITLFLPMTLGLLAVVVRAGLAMTLRLGRAGLALPSWEELLLVGNGLLSILLISHPEVPHFGGTKHWYPSMPFLGLLGGAVVAQSAAVLSEKLSGWTSRLPQWTSAGLLLSALFFPAWVDTTRIYRYGTSSYSELAGGLPGAATLGMQRQFWSNNVTGVLPWINQNAPFGSRLWLHEVNGLSFRDYQENGMLRSDLRPAGGPQDADIAAVQYHQEFREHEYNVWEAFGTTKPVAGLYLDETPQVVVYRRF